MNARTKAKALSSLDGMREIVRREMLIQGVYIDPEVSNPRLAGAICGGHKHCAIGSLWAGAGIKPKRSWTGSIDLPGAASYQRQDFVYRRPGLRAALEALNNAARRFAESYELELDEGGFGDDIEALFEGHYGEDLTKRDLLAIIADAKRRIKRA